MNIEQANAISMTFFLEQLGIIPEKETEFSATFLSPIRKERTASFQVNKKKNRWYDHGTGAGGDLVNFVCQYLQCKKENHNVPDALRYIKNMAGLVPRIKSITVEPTENEQSLILKSAETLGHIALFNYLGNRGIDLKIAMNYLDKVKVYNKLSGKYITALGFRNDNDGYELRNRAFKGCVGSKYISFVRGTNPNSKAIHVFEGFMDFLTLLTMRESFKLTEDAIILNSLVCLDKASPYINDYGYELAYTWMDNDIAGEKATVELENFFKQQVGLTHKPMNDVYCKAKDLNAWHMHNLNLKL